MYYDKLTKEGEKFAQILAQKAGIEGKVTREYAPWGEKFAFFKLSKPAIGADCAAACKKLEQAGFDPDLLFMGTPPEVRGGFIGKRFSVLATELKNANQ